MITSLQASPSNLDTRFASLFLAMGSGDDQSAALETLLREVCGSFEIRFLSSLSKTRPLPSQPSIAITKLEESSVISQRNLTGPTPARDDNPISLLYVGLMGVVTVTHSVRSPGHLL